MMHRENATGPLHEEHQSSYELYHAARMARSEATGRALAGVAATLWQRVREAMIFIRMRGQGGSVPRLDGRMLRELAMRTRD